MKKEYHIFYLEMALKDSHDLNIYAYENISHISTNKLIEIFEIDLNKDPCLLEGYFLNEPSYEKHKKFINDNIGEINLDVFEYTLQQYVTEDINDIRKFYKESLME